MKKFKAVVTTSEQPVHEEISESQQRKLDQQKKKLEAEIAAKKEAERIAKQKEDERKVAEEKRVEEEYRRRTEEMFKNLSKAQELIAKDKKPVTKFEDVMMEEEKKTKADQNKQDRIDAKRRALNGPQMTFDYAGKTNSQPIAAIPTAAAFDAQMKKASKK